MSYSIGEWPPCLIAVPADPQVAALLDSTDRALASYRRVADNGDASTSELAMAAMPLVDLAEQLAAALREAVTP